MKIIKRVVAVMLAVLILSTVAAISTSAVTDETAEVAASTEIVVHYKATSSSVPSIYYWNSLPTNIETDYPGKAMQLDSSQGDKWYTYKFADKTKINAMFIENGTQSKEFTFNCSGNKNEFWVMNNKQTTFNPEQVQPADRTDMREDSIYFVMTTRFYDGDTGNNVHCWDDSQAGNPDSDPAWRGDFQGLIDKLDYIKALGFSAIWITPVVTNASGYDYHGYHAMDFSTVDVRYESPGATFEDLILAVHEKDMKIVQDVVFNHSGNFGEATLAPMFEKEYETIQDLATADSMKIIEGSELDKSYPNYDSLQPTPQFQARLSIMKNTDGKNHDVNNYYHHSPDMSWETSSEQTGQIAGDCVDINTENQVVADYITETYLDYANMGVDGFRMDTEKHINRWTLNNAYFPKFTSIENFFFFGEVCVRAHDNWNKGAVSSSVPFFTWAETKSEWKSNWSTTDHAANLANSVKHYNAHSDTSSQPTSTNAFLNGNEYHTPDYSQGNGTSVIDFKMHWNFSNAESAFHAGKDQDKYMNDSTWNVTYVDSHDYGPNMDNRYNGGTDAWAENLCLLFTFRGVPCLYYGSEVEFKCDVPMDVGPNAPLEQTGRAYFGDYLEGDVTSSDFSTYSASGAVANTLNQPLAKHLSRLNAIRRAVPALQKGQYSTDNVSGNVAFKRGYTNPDTGEKSFVCVAITDSATFTEIPNGTYIDAVTGDTKSVSNGTLSIPSTGKGNMRVYVLSSNGYTGISGKVTTSSITSDPYLK